MSRTLHEVTHSPAIRGVWFVTGASPSTKPGKKPLSWACVELQPNGVGDYYAPVTFRETLGHFTGKCIDLPPSLLRLIVEGVHPTHL